MVIVDARIFPGDRAVAYLSIDTFSGREPTRGLIARGQRLVSSISVPILRRESRDATPSSEAGVFL